MRGFVRRLALIAGTGAAVTLMVGCDEELPTEGPGAASAPDAQSVSQETAFSNALSQARAIDGYMVDRAHDPRPAITDPKALAEELVANGGGATVFFKNPATSRFYGTGRSAGAARKAPVSEASIKAGLRLLRDNGVKLGSYLDAMAAVIATVPASAAGTITASPYVDYVAPARASHWIMGAVSPLSASVDFAESTPWGISAVKAPLAWSASAGQGASVMIIDNGYDNTHPDLPSIPQSNCLNSGACGNTFSHGTAVAGVIAAIDNSVGVIGVAPGVAASDLYSYKACGGVVCSDTMIENALNEAANLGIDVVNMSFSSDSLAPEVADGVGAASAGGAVLVAAAGRHCASGEGCGLSFPDTLRYPAALSDVIAVSGVNDDLSYADVPNDRHPACNGFSSNSGLHISVSAPNDAMTTDSDPFNPYSVWCGTSFAAPHVSAVAAMIRAMSPFLPAWQVEQRLEITSVDLGPSGLDARYGEGLVDARAATGPHVSVEGPEGQVPPDAECEWTASAIGGVDPKTFEWYDDNVLIETGPNLVLNTGSAGGSFELELIVEDDQFFQDSWQASIDVEEDEPETLTVASSLGEGSEFCDTGVPSHP